MDTCVVVCCFNDRGGRIVSVEEVDACTFTVYTSAIYIILSTMAVAGQSRLSDLNGGQQQEAMFLLTHWT